MHKQKAEVVKSKSISMSETKNNSQKRDRKSRSNAEIKPLGLKKRGVYVEKKTTKISIRNNDDSPDSVLTKKPSQCLRPIPRPGRKRFLASVLSILSKSTAGTQCPEQCKLELEQTVHTLKIKRDEENKLVQEDSKSKKKCRYRTKFIKNEGREMQANSSLKVLQSTKDTRTPSNSDISNNEKESVTTYVNQKTVNWASGLPPNIGNIEPKITEVNMIKSIEKYPSTFLTECANRDDKNIYNFFVDLLKTSFSVYNVKTEFNQPLPPSRTSSKVELEIDESVAKKLNIAKVKPSNETNEIARKPSSNFYCSIKPDDSLNWDDEQLLEHFQPRKSKRRYREQSPPTSPIRRRKIKSDSFDTTRTTKKAIPKTTSVTTPNKKVQTQKKDLKAQFLNSLKEQLRMRPEELEEPQNFFEALKVIARNKKRCQQSIHRKASTKPSEGDVHVCQFKRRRVLSAIKHSGKQSKHTESRYTNNSYPTTSKKRSRIRIPETSESEMDSKHSLAVFGYDYLPKKLQDHKYEDGLKLPQSSLVSVQDFNKFLE